MAAMHGTKRQRTSSDATANGRPEHGDAATKPQMTRACAECKRHKIRCFVQPGQTACTKCLKSGIHCVPHNFAQKFMDDDAEWKANATETIVRLTAAVNHLLQYNKLPPLMEYDSEEAQHGSPGRPEDRGRASSADGARQSDTERIQRNASSSGNGIAGGAASAPPAPAVVSPAASHVSSSATAAAASGNFISEGPSADLQEDDSDLVPLPMNNLYSLTDPAKSHLIRVDPTCVNGPDFISRGVVSFEEAEFLFSHFLTHINPLLWDGMLCSHTTLQAARASSSLLVATVLTVAAMHLAGGTGHHLSGEEQQQQKQPNERRSRPSLLQTTYDAFVQLMRASCLLRSQNLDDVRGLCIGAFYLTSLSWALCSRAIRVATEMNLHKSSLQFAAKRSSGPATTTTSTKATFTSSSSGTASPSYGLEQYERVQLWYVLYVCDHQFALAYGRPPMMHDDAAIRNTDKLLAMSGSLSSAAVATSSLPAAKAARGNHWLVAQVKLFRILAGAYFLYGCDPDLALSGQDYERLQSFNLSLDQWRLEEQQQSRCGPGADEVLFMGASLNRGDRGDRPSTPKTNKVTTLYYHLARFQLNSLSLRGISARGAEAGKDASLGLDDIGLDMPWERQEAANNAIAAASSTIRLIVEDADLRAMQIGMPIFVHAMIAVCASFLLKMAVVFSASGSDRNHTTQTAGAASSNSGNILPLPRDLARYGLNFHTKNALADVESLVRVFSVVADNASQQHVARQVVTGLRELLQRFRPGATPDTFVYVRAGVPAPSAVPGSMAMANGNVNNNASNMNGTTGHSNGGVAYVSDISAAPDQQGPGTVGYGSGHQATMMQQPLLDANSSYMNGQAAGENVVYSTTMATGQHLNDCTMQPGGSLEYQEDPFNLMGDLDWRFNDAFLWGIQADPPFL